MATPLMTRSAYAKYRRERGLAGGSPPAVLYAIREGRITTTPEGLIDPDKADREWAENTNPIQQMAGVKAGAARAAQIREGLGKSKKENASKLESTGDRSEDGNSIPSPTAQRGDYQSSRAAREYYESELARLKFEEKKKQLIPASVVRKVMYEAGRIIRAGHDDLKAQLSPDLASTNDIAETEKLLGASLDALDNRLADFILKLDEKLVAVDEDTTEVGVD